MIWLTHKFLAAGIGAPLFSAVVASGEAASVKLDIQSMDCASCPLTLKAVLKKASGVSEVSVDYKNHSARFRFDPAKTAPEQLAKAVSAIGYPTTMKR